MEGKGAEPGGPSRPLFAGTLSDIDLRLLRVFAAVAECNGFAAAEVRLNKGKSAISADIADLERRLRVRLCHRGRSGFSLTEAGTVVLGAAQSVFSSVDEFRNQVNSVSERLAGELVLCVIDNLVIHRESPLSDALGSFGRKHPDVFINIVSQPAGGVEQAVLEGSGDIGLTVLTRRHPTLAEHPIFAETLHLYIGRSHPLFSVPDSDIDLDDVRQQPLIETSLLQQPNLLGVACPQLSFSARANSLDARAIAILSGLFAGILPEKYAELWVAAGEMRPLRPDIICGTDTFYVIFRKAASSKLIARAFYETLLDRCRKETAADEGHSIRR